jgi:PPK2 family polyphosphate:nucleotide phosphotransferase
LAKRKDSARLAEHRFADAPLAHATGAKAPLRRSAFALARVDPRARPFSLGDKSEDKAAIDALALEIDHLQDLFYADRRFKMLVVLQGTDTSGEDGTIRAVFNRTSALGVHAVAWKAPTEQERAHDYLWRIHKEVPGAGEIVLFNRSHYEAVIVPVVKGWITKDETAQRYAQISDFERMLVETGTVVLKFFFHVSKEEQRLRLQERLDDPTKHWKFAIGDLEERKSWNSYQGDLFGRHRGDRNALGAVDCRAGRLEDASQPDDRNGREAGAAWPEALLSARRPRPGRPQGRVMP